MIRNDRTPGDENTYCITCMEIEGRVECICKVIDDISDFEKYKNRICCNCDEQFESIDALDAHQYGGCHIIKEEEPELTEHQKKIADALVLAAAGSITLSGLEGERALEIMQFIVEAAPRHLHDDLPRCCAYFIYRDILMQASGSSSLELILEAQNEINKMLGD